MAVHPGKTAYTLTGHKPGLSMLWKIQYSLKYKIYRLPLPITFRIMQDHNNYSAPALLKDV